MRRADVATPAILWFVTILAAVIIITWFVQSSAINQVDVRSIDEDLKNLRYELGLACAYSSFETSQQLYTSRGSLIVNETSACITQGLPEGVIRRCLPTPCEVESVEFDLSQHSTIRVEKTADGIEVSGE